MKKKTESEEDSDQTNEAGNHLLRYYAIRKRQKLMDIKGALWQSVALSLHS